MTVILAVTIPHSVKAVAWGLAAMSFCEFAINFAASMRYSTLGIGRMVRTLLPTMAITVIMVLAVHFTSYAMVDCGVMTRLVAEIAVGAMTYLLLALTFRLEAFGEIRTLITKIISR